jgi:nitrate/TMAO reductase-like tetraheme cytochrome c subunit
METLVKPPARPLKTLSMDDCIGCHQKAGASVEKVAARARGPASGIRPLSTDCNSCHR